MTPTCICDGSTVPWEGHMPTCGEARCLLRWWLRYGLPVLVVIVVIVAVGLYFGPDQVCELGCVR
jgi:hypothetical protein